MIIAHGLSDVGLVRRNNEDSYLIDETLQIAIVADGMGGHNAGEVASRMAVDVVHAHLRGLGRAIQLSDLIEAVRRASRAIYERGRADPDLEGMGTTITLCARVEKHVLLAHVGDSRAYRIRGGEIEQLTEDHTLVAEMERAGLLRDGAKGPPSNIVTRSVGYEAETAVDALAVELAEGDMFVLVSDGVSNEVSGAEILELVTHHFLREAPARLISTANGRGGRDNATAVIVYANPGE